MDVTSVSSNHSQSGFPAGSVMGALAETLDDLKETGSKVLKISVNDPLYRINQQLSDLDVQQMVAAQEVDRAAKSVSSFTNGSYVSSLLYATSSIIAGGLVYYVKGDEKGKQLAYAGALQLANTVLTNTGGWNLICRTLSLGNKTAEQIMQQLFPTAVTLLTHYWNSRNIANLSPDDQDKMKVLNQLLSLINIALSVGQVYSKFKLSQAERRAQEIDFQMQELNIQFTDLMQHKKVSSAAFKNIEKGYKEIIKTQINSGADSAKNN